MRTGIGIVVAAAFSLPLSAFASTLTFSPASPQLFDGTSDIFVTQSGDTLDTAVFLSSGEWIGVFYGTDGSALFSTLLGTPFQQMVEATNPANPAPYYGSVKFISYSNAVDTADINGPQCQTDLATCEASAAYAAGNRADDRTYTLTAPVPRDTGGMPAGILLSGTTTTAAASLAAVGSTISNVFNTYKYLIAFPIGIFIAFLLIEQFIMLVGNFASDRGEEKGGGFISGSTWVKWKDDALGSNLAEYSELDDAGIVP